MIAIIYYLAAFGAIFSLTGLFAVVIGVGLQEFEASRELLTYVVGLGFVSASILLSIANRNHVLTRMQGFFLCIASWIIVPLVLAFALADLLQVEYSIAMFNTFSAFTTNGALSIANYEAVPKLAVLTLALIQWLGGLATLLTVTVILAPSGIGGLREDTRTALGNSLISSRDRLHNFAVELAQIYGAITLACFVAILLCGVAPYEALILSLSMSSTGGIAPSEESVDLLLGPSGMAICSFFLLIGATSIFWHRMIVMGLREEISRHRESYAVLGVWFVAAIVFVYAIANASGGTISNFASVLGEGAFNAASVISTSGMQSRAGIFPLLPSVLVMIALFVGAGCYSASGGLKMYRIGGMFSQSLHELNRLVFPSIAPPAHFGTQTFDITLIKSIWSLFAMSVIAVFIGSFLLTLAGLEFEAALIAAVSNFATAGPAYGPEWSSGSAQGWPDYFEMTTFAHITLICLMVMGRLELIAVLALFNLQYWRNA